MKIVKQDKYKAAIIGVGRIGMKLEEDPRRLKPATHFGMWDLNGNTVLTAVCDTVEVSLKVARERKPGIKVYTSAEQLLRHEMPDVVSIATWKDTHYEMVKLCLKYEVPAIVCEKPISETMEQAREIVREANEKGVHFFVNHRRRFDELIYPLKADLENGVIGEIIQGHVTYVYGLKTTGTHAIDTLGFMLGDIAEDVSWVVGFKNRFRHFAPVDDPA